jgi:hypothetical protein
MNQDKDNQKRILPMAPPIPAEIDGPRPGKTAQHASIADVVAGFLSRYLACEPHQLTVLTLWIIYTRCFERFPTAAYLNIRSPEPQSGKSLCLQLLKLLCDSPWMAAGADVRTITGCLLASRNLIKTGEDFETEPPYTILLDDCHHALNGSEHQPLLAILNSGSHVMGRYPSFPYEYCVFGPKAFAGNAPLPASLASRCIPIVLHRKRPSDDLSRCDRGLRRENVEGLLEALAGWAKANANAIDRAAEEDPAGIPPGLSPREQGCAEPLLHIADLIGGPWPEKARAALAVVFNLAESSPSVQMLCDVRVAFSSRNNPEYLSTRDILSVIGAFEYRPWSAWPRNSGRRLGALLHPFGIVSRNLRVDSETVLRGYLLRDFQDAWERYLSPAIYAPAPCSTTDSSSATPSYEDSMRLA